MESEPAQDAAQAVIAVTEKQYMSFKMAHEFCKFAFASQDRSNWDKISNQEDKAHLEMVREVYGNPFQMDELKQQKSNWTNKTIVNIAESIYQDNEFGDLGVLGDALEEAGCDSSEVLDHCRASEGHFKGCWVVDLIRG